MNRSTAGKRARPYRILSCDGGGIRGLLTSLMIQHLQTGCGFLDQVDLFAGTSAGAIISVALAGDVPIDRLVDLFANDGPTIFTRFRPEYRVTAPRPRLDVKGPGDAKDWEKLWDKILGGLESLLFVKYSQTGIFSLLKALLPDKPLKQLRGVMVTTFQLQNSDGNWKPLILSNLPESIGGDTLALDAAMSSGAAPSYMPPYPHPQYGYCVDGGVVANNPSALAVALAQRAGVATEDIRLLSLGTGRGPCGMKVLPPPTNYGPLLWLLPFSLEGTPALPLLNIQSALLTDSPGDTASFQCQQMLGTNFMRADVPLQKGIEIDDYQAVPEMAAAAKAYCDSADWSTIESWVRGSFLSGGNRIS